MQRICSGLCLASGLGLLALSGIMWHHSIVQRTPPTYIHPVASRSVSPTLSYGKLPIAFESNQGQVDKQVRFLSHGRGYNLFLTSNEAVLSLSHPDAAMATIPARHGPHLLRSRTARSTRSDTSDRYSTSVLRIKLLGANAHPQMSGQNKLPGIVNYFIGNDPQKWRTHIPTYGRVEYKSVYPGIDMVYYGNQQQLEYDWVVAPGADVHKIQLGIKGAEKASLTPKGDLNLHTVCGDVIQHAPIVYQEVDGVCKPVSGRLVLQDPISGEEECRIGFEVTTYDHTRPLVIDPVLVYSTYLGGSGGDKGTGIAVDSSGNAYTTGTTLSTDFPVLNALQSSNHSSGGSNIFISKINAAGSALDYSTYLGGSASDYAYSIAVDSAGSAYVTGFTYSTDFPLKNALQSINHGTNAFVTKLNSSGSSLIYSTYLGGSGIDEGRGIAVDSYGNAYVTGMDSSLDFPIKNALQSVNHGGRGHYNAFITEINASGSALVYSTYLGGSGGLDYANGIAVDTSGNVYVTGETDSTDFPLKNALQSSNYASSQSSNVFVTKINASGSALVYSTYLGGSSGDYGNAIAVDSAGNAYVTGITGDTDFPINNAFQSTNHASNAFVTKFNVSGSVLVYSTYLGGSGIHGDEGRGIAVDGSGNAYVTGETSSTDFPLKNALQSVNQSVNQKLGGTQQHTGFITEINASGSSLVFSTYLGGSGTNTGGGDQANGIAVDSAGNSYITGETGSTDFPVQNPLQSVNLASSVGSNAFIARIGNYNWQTVDIAVGSDDQTRLLWTNTNRSAAFWSVNTGGAVSNAVYDGPYTNFTVQAIATGSDGLTRALWNNDNGSISLWLVNANNTFNTSTNFGPYTDCAAVDLTVGSDNSTRLLWANANGAVALWSVTNQGQVVNPTNFGPYAGWTVRSISAGADGLTRVLWRNANGSISLWLVNANNTFNRSYNFGPYTGWNAIDLAVGSDNNTRLLWTKTDGTVCIFTVNNQGQISNSTTFGPLTGWNATRIAGGSDGFTRLVWFKNIGIQSLWLLNANNSYYGGNNFGPY